MDIINEFEIIKLQKEYKVGKIKEVNMTQEQKDCLIELYKKQNTELKETINSKKKIIRRKLDDLKKM